MRNGSYRSKLALEYNYIILPVITAENPDKGKSSE